MGRIVVGVDGSEGSRKALEWAVEEARLREASLEVIHTYEHDIRWMSYRADESMSAAQMDAVHASIEAAAEEAARQAQGLVADMVEGIEGIEVAAAAVESSHPADALVDRARDADLLVVGSRGRGGFKSLMLGSVSQQCAIHAECPVAIIRP